MRVRYDVNNLITDKFAFFKYVEYMTTTVGVLNDQDELVSFVAYTVTAGELDIVFAETLPEYQGNYYCSSLISALVRANNIILCKLVALNAASEKYFKDLVDLTILPSNTVII